MDRRGIAIRAGLVAPPIALAGVVLAALLAPEFDWWSGALSHLGEVPPGAAGPLDHPGALLFDASLIVAGALGFLFAALRYREAYHPLQRSGAAALALAFLGLAGTGVFSQPGPLHVPLQLATILAATAALWLYGAGTAAAGRFATGVATAVAGLLVVGLWLAWEHVLDAPGTAVPELAVVVALVGWTYDEAATLYRAAEGHSVRDGLASAVGGGSSGTAD